MGGEGHYIWGKGRYFLSSALGRVILKMCHWGKGYDFLALQILPLVNDYGNEADDDGSGDGDNGDSNDKYSYSEDVQISDILPFGGYYQIW